MVLFNLASNFAHPVTPTIIQDLRLPDYMFGLMMAAMQISNFLFSPFWGKINATLSSRKTLLICCAGYGGAQLLFACSTTQLAILAARVLAGIFVGGVFVSFLTYVIHTARPEDQAKYLAYSATIQAVSAAFGYLVGGVLGEFSIRGTFLLQAATLTGSGILFRLVCLPDSTASESLPVKQLLRQSNPLQAFLDGRKFMNASFALLFALNILMNFGNTGFDQVFNYYLKDQLGLTSSYNGVIKAAVGFIAFVSNMTLCLWIIRRTNIRRSMVGMSLFCTAASLGAGLKRILSPFSAARRMMASRPLISFCNKRISPASTLARAAATVSGLTARLAPPRMMMEFSPWGETWMMAWPVGTSTWATADTSAPASRKRANSMSPSAPTAPPWKTCAPARAAATVWFKPLPPANTSRRLAGRVSPASTKWGTAYT